MKEAGSNTLFPKDRIEWREWLRKHHSVKQSIWLVYAKRSDPLFNLDWDAAVDEALCFGWIDSTKRAIDDRFYMQYFSPRKAKSTWSRVNKQKVARLIAEGKMEDSGMAIINIAKSTEAWTLLDDVEDLILPEDLEKALESNADAKAYFDALSRSEKKRLLLTLVVVKTHAARERRIQQFLALMKKGVNN